MIHNRPAISQLYWVIILLVLGIAILALQAGIGKTVLDQFVNTIMNMFTFLSPR